MSVTPGFAMHIGDYPPAVSLPPIAPPVQVRPPTIEVQVVSETGPASTCSAMFYGRQSAGLNSQQLFSSHGATYTSRGSHSASGERSGHFLDIFA